MDVYEELLALTEREHALVTAGAWEELAALDAIRRETFARLPLTAPESARATLERAAHIQAQTTALLGSAAGELRRELGTLSQGRAAVRGYAGGVGVSAAGAAGATGGRRVDVAG